nr:MAG TPA: hypothetical protein [Caudoviricetes sp.]
MRGSQELSSSAKYQVNRYYPAGTLCYQAKIWSLITGFCLSF